MIDPQGCLATWLFARYLIILNIIIILTMIVHCVEHARRQRGEAGSAHAPNNFENNGATSPALIRCIVLYCFKNNCPLNLHLLPTALVRRDSGTTYL